MITTRLLKLHSVQDEDPWLGAVLEFPAVLHARASFVYEITIETFQRTLIYSLMELQKKTRPIELSLSDQPGYHGGLMTWKVGVGNRDGFDILNAKEENRVLSKIISQGVYPLLDFSLDLHYRTRSSGRHRIAGDRYLVRFTFQPSRAELLVHHLKGLRRFDPGELIRLLLSAMNAMLEERGYEGIELGESIVE